MNILIWWFLCSQLKLHFHLLQEIWSSVEWNNHLLWQYLTISGLNGRKLYKTIFQYRIILFYNISFVHFCLNTSQWYHSHISVSYILRLAHRHIYVYEYMVLYLHTDNCKEFYIVNNTINFPLMYNSFCFHLLPPFRDIQSKYNLSSI